MVRILIVDDDPADVELTKRALRNERGCEVLDVVHDGVEALSYLRNESPYEENPRPDLILLDLNMPRKDGRETLRDIKADEALRTIPVIVLTTSDAQPDVIASYSLQASCYLTKPTELSQFTEVIGSINNFWLRFVKYPEQGRS